ncbi:MAG: type IV pilin N-terminal domain-containing protein [Halobacteria archaeon]|nr:type IV pilin N-terminal domain-containing protein [Halobacteria archaeon]
MAQKNRNGADDAVSPVIGVILMVAITVILAAVIGTFVLGLGGQVQQNAQAGVTFEQSSSGQVNITLNSVQRADTIYVNWGNGTTHEAWGSPSSSIGDTFHSGGTLSSGTQVVVIGEVDGSNSTIQSYTVK